VIREGPLSFRARFRAAVERRSRGRLRASFADIGRVAVLVAAGLCTGTVRADVVRVAVATNFANAMDALAASFAARSEHEVLVSSGSSGAHFAQIKNGAPFHAFFSADAQRPKRLEEEGVAVHGSRFVYAVGRLVLWSARADYVDGDGRVLETGTFRRLAIANPELAPYGAAAREVLRARGLWDALQPKIVRGQDVGQTYSFVYTGNAELGFVAYSQLAQPGHTLEGSQWLVPAELHSPIVQEAVLLLDEPAARAFLEYVKTPEAREIIRRFGYGP
jgi:molybdate transport system substrate-binding protein